MSVTDEKYLELGGKDGPLGAQTHAEEFAPDGSGVVARYEWGLIAWSDETGAHDVRGAVAEHWLNTGAGSGPFGYPVADAWGDKTEEVGKFQNGWIRGTADGGVTCSMSEGTKGEGLDTTAEWVESAEISQALAELAEPVKDATTTLVAEIPDHLLESVQMLDAAVVKLLLPDPSPDFGTVVQPIVQEVPQATTIWQFWQTYTGGDKSVRLRKSFALARIGGCTGAMIAPHILLTAAHCGGPGWRGWADFFRIDEDSTSPGAAAQAVDRYYAQTFPWQVIGQNSARGTIPGGDFCLWWVYENADAIPAGIKYGMLDLDTDPMEVGHEAYSFWINPVTNFNGSSLGTTVLHSSGRATARNEGPGLGRSTRYSIYNAPGGSGSPVLRAGGHGVVGVTSLGASPEGDWREAVDVDAFVGRFDSDRNLALDAVEYDWLMTQPRRPFMLFDFGTSAERSRWMADPSAPASVPSTESGAWALKLAAPRHQGTIQEYDCAWHRTARFRPGATYRFSMLVRSESSVGRGYVKLLSEPGMTARRTSFWAAPNWKRVTGRFTLDDVGDYRLILGSDAGRTLHIQNLAFVEEQGKLDFETGAERYCWECPGRSYVTSWGIRGAADFSGVVVGPVSPDAPFGLRNRFVGLRSNRRYELVFNTSYVRGFGGGGWVRVGTIGPQSVVLSQSWRWADLPPGLHTHRMQFTTDANAGHTLTFGTNDVCTFMVDEISLREVGMTLAFEFPDEVQTWQTARGSFIGASQREWGRMAGYVWGPCPAPGWGTRNASLDLQMNRAYEVLFTPRHNPGFPIDANLSVDIRDLAGNAVLSRRWRFAARGEAPPMRVPFRTGGSNRLAISFGADADISYSIDRVELREL